MVKEAGLEDQIDVESAGVGPWHVGQPPHAGTRRVLADHHISVGNKRARQVNRADFKQFDYLVAMDNENVQDIQAYFGSRIPRLLDFAKPDLPKDVPDPYYAGNFDEVYQLVVQGCRALLDRIRAKEII